MGCNEGGSVVFLQESYLDLFSLQDQPLFWRRLRAN